MTKEKPSSGLGISEGADRRDQHLQNSTHFPQNQSLNERSEIPILMTRQQLAYLVALHRRLGDHHLQEAMGRLGFSGPAIDLSAAQAGRLIAELRRAEGRR